MADPVTILTSSGPVVLARVTALWIYEQIASDDELGETRSALDECLRGFPVARSLLRAAQRGSRGHVSFTTFIVRDAGN